MANARLRPLIWVLGLLAAGGAVGLGLMVARRSAARPGDAVMAEAPLAPAGSTAEPQPDRAEPPPPSAAGAVRADSGNDPTPNPRAVAPAVATPTSASPATAAPSAPRDLEPASRFAANLPEPILMARLREAAGSDLALAIRLARAGNRRFPDSQDAPERYAILIHALAAQGQASSARGEAEYMVNHFSDSAWVGEVERFSGAHRHRNVRVSDAGVLQFE